MEKVVEHVVESAVKAVEGEKIKRSLNVEGSAGYLDEKKLSEIASKARGDDFGRVAVVKGEGGQVYLKAGHEDVEIKRSKFTVANLITGEKKKI
jgi:hypothetical protein